jgi:hypothetical protein
MKVPLFECGDVVFCRSWDEWNKLHAGLGADGGQAYGYGASRTLSSESGTIFIIGVFNSKSSTLAHECAHIAFDICKRVGVVVEQGRANETYCYLISSLFDFCDKQMKKPE